MKALLIAYATSLLIAAPAFADSHDVGPGQELAKRIFGSIENNAHGLADMGEFTSFGNDIFVSMDADNNAKISMKEFKEWDFGLVPKPGSFGPGPRFVDETAYDGAESLNYRLETTSEK